jgi:hypothetical protein
MGSFYEEPIQIIKSQEFRSLLPFLQVLYSPAT